MARLIAVLLVFWTAGILIADAQCNILCSAKRSSAGCHHNTRPADTPQCVHQQGLTSAWLFTNIERAARPLVAVAAQISTRTPGAEPSRESAILPVITVQPSEP